MRLKRIEISGFKSFGDKEVLEFPLGITVIVGPNGCGKSNIADAFRWVLGEQSAKSIRGSKMHDLIFAGTTNRKPVNVAEVTLTFTDVAGSLPIDYEEVSITRRLHRTGESEYLINRTPARLKDLQSLFLDSGVGHDAFSIFEQGKIDQVINLSPTDRRSIFEDAAGIARFLLRKRESLRKLEQTDLNMSRIKDIHKEVEKQVALLEQQAHKAKLFKEKRLELDLLERRMLVFRWETTNRKWRTAKQKTEENKQQLSSANKKLEQWQKQLHELKDALEEAEKVVWKEKEALFAARSAKEMQAKEVQTHSEKLQEAVGRQKILEKEIAEILQKRQQLIEENKKSTEAGKLLEKQLADAETLLREYRQHTQKLDAEVSKLREQQLKAQQERVRQVQAEGQASNELNQIQMRIEHHEERMEQLKARQRQLISAIETHESTVEEKKRLLQSNQKAVEAQKETLKKLQGRLVDCAEEIQKIQREKTGHEQALAESRARLKVLLRLREEMQGFSPGTKRLLQESRNPKASLYNKLQPLYELFSIEKEKQEGSIVTMRPYMQTLVVKTQTDFDQVLSFARQQGVKEFSLLCLEDISSRPEQHTSGSYLIDSNSGNAIVSHFLRHVHHVSDRENAKKLFSIYPGIEAWTEEGTFIDRHNVVFLPMQGESNVFARESEIKALENEIAEKENKSRQLETTVKTLQQEKAALQTEADLADKAVRKEEMKVVEMNFVLQRAQTDLDRARKEQEQQQKEQAQLLEGLEKLKTSLKDTLERHASAKKRASDVQQTALVTDAELEDRLAVLRRHHKEQREQETVYQKLLEENQKLTYTRNIAEMREQEGRQQEVKLQQELLSSKEAQAKFTMLIQKGSQQQQQNTETLTAQENTYRSVESKLAEYKKIMAETDAQGDDIRQQNKLYEQDDYQYSSQLSQLEATRQTIEAELLDRYHWSVEEALNFSKEYEQAPEPNEKQVRHLRQELDSLGDVNMTAIEECEEQQSRHHFLTTQIQDLTLSREELVKIITDLEVESRRMFADTFRVVRENFQKNFQILFNGGEADLQFTDTHDILEAGIEIIAKPPGKQMRSISLLSGGEKCLTALALLFAIFEVKPAPFCILDEIDAPLDDTNIERFVAVLKQFIDRCQFLIITHNKRTMAIADKIFGISMEEKGVSKLLSLSFSHKEEQEPIFSA